MVAPALDIVDGPAANAGAVQVTLQKRIAKELELATFCKDWDRVRLREARDECPGGHGREAVPDIDYSSWQPSQSGRSDLQA